MFDVNSDGGALSAPRTYADLHIHSKFSRACSRDCDLEHLAWWAGRKGIGVVGTGDFTHPAWREELGAKLVPDAPGLFRLRPDLERAVHDTLPPACRTPVRFMLSSEISTIYKRDDRTRKVHHLLYAPSLDAVDAITAALARVGNLAADGRPILGLDSRNLLEITLSGGDGCYLVPAHAWTPWFAVLGSQSGFDRVADCYADLADHICAIETGLSSDPAMNWRVSSLDGYRLVSNSDAHSPPMLGREATAFRLADVDYFTVYRALRTGDGFGGTVEFFPEEGKYHLDGHRACDVRMTPEETRAAGGKCPGCGKKPTIGVQHRVDTLADRPDGYRPEGAAGFASFVQLPEILGEIAGVGPKSKSVTAQASAMVERFGPELAILGDVPLDDLAAGAPSVVAEAIARLRRGEVRREAGYDGVYGTIRLFEPDELAGAALFDLPRAARAMRAAARRGAGGDAVAAGPRQRRRATGGGRRGRASGGGRAARPGPRAARDRHPRGRTAARGGRSGRRQDAGADARDRAPGRRGPAARAVPGRHVHPPRPRRAARPAHRAARRGHRRPGHRRHLPRPRPAHPPRAVLAARPRRRPQGRRREDPPGGAAVAVHGGSPAALGARIAAAKRMRVSAASAGFDPVGAGGGDAGFTGPEPDGLAARYDAALRERGLVDVDDLVTLPVLLLGADASLAAAYRARWTDVFVDEYQDVDEQQYLMLRLICLPGGRPPVPTDGAPDGAPMISGAQAAPGSRICAIGDPDQAIYGFRGGDVGYFLRFAEDFGGTGSPACATTVRLSRSYRSAPTIVRAAMQLIRPGTLVPGRELIPAGPTSPTRPVVLHAVADEREEAEAVAAEIEKLLGGASFHALDSRAVDGRDRAEHQLSFADFAVLYRTSSQAAAIGEALARRGFPFQRRAHSRLAEMPGVTAILAALPAPTVTGASRPHCAAHPRWGLVQACGRGRHGSVAELLGWRGSALSGRSGRMK